MSSKSERRAAVEVDVEYHEALLAELVQRVGDAVDRLRAGELDAFEADQVIFQYSRAAKELWKFCNPPREASSLSANELAKATALARRVIASEKATVYSATVTVSAGKRLDSHTGYPCTSGGCSTSS